MADKRREYSSRYLGEGVAVSNDTWITGLNNNDMIVGSSGASKTGSIVHPQLKTLSDESLVVVDTKGRLFRMFRDELREKGYKVRVLDFANPERSCTYNPLKYIRRKRNGKLIEQDIAKFAAVILPDTWEAKDPFWVQVSRVTLEFLIAYTLSALPEEDHDIFAVADIYRAYLKPSGRATLQEWVEKNPRTLAAKRYGEMMGMYAAEKMSASVNGFINTSLKPFEYEELEDIFKAVKEGPYSLWPEEEDILFFDDPYEVDDTDWMIKSEDLVKVDGRIDQDEIDEILETCEREELDLAALGREKTVLFLNVSDCDHSQDMLVNMLYSQLLQTLIAEADANESGQLDVPVRIIMDDFAASAQIPDFDKIISVVRSRDIWLTLCIQSFTQLDSLYSEAKALTIVNNCDHIVYLGGNDMKSAEFIGTRACKTPESVLCMDRTKEFFIESGKPVKLINKIKSYSFGMEDISAEAE